MQGWAGASQTLHAPMPAAAAYRAAPGSPYLPPGFEAHPQQPKCSQSLEATAPAGSFIPPAGSTYANVNPAPAAFAPAAAPPSLPLHPSHAQPQPPHQAALRPPAAPAPHGLHTHSSSTQQTGAPLAAAPLAKPGVSVATPSASKDPSPKAAPTANVWLFPLADAARARSRSRLASRACPKAGLSRSMHAGVLRRCCAFQNLHAVPTTDAMSRSANEGAQLPDDLQARLNALRLADEPDALCHRPVDEQSLDSLAARLAALNAPLISESCEAPLTIPGDTLDPSRFPAIPGSELAGVKARPRPPRVPPRSMHSRRACACPASR